MDQDLGNHSWTQHIGSSSSSFSSPLHSGIHNNKVAASAATGSQPAHQNGPNSLHHRHHHHHHHHRDHHTSPLRKVTNHVLTNLRKINSTQVSQQNHVIGLHKDKLCASSNSPAGPSLVGFKWSGGIGASLPGYGPERTLLLPTTPDEVREEVDMLLSDLVVRLKQLLFNSLLCAYYVGFIPMQFADVSTIVKKWIYNLQWNLS